MTPKFHFTNHAHYKMRFYRLSEQIVRGVILRPKRVEEGIAPNTVAYMKQAGSKTKPYEIWVMCAAKPHVSGVDGEVSSVKDELSMVKGQLSNVTRVISAWRYPGLTKPGKPLPKEILHEIEEASA